MKIIKMPSLYCSGFIPLLPGVAVKTLWRGACGGTSDRCWQGRHRTSPLTSGVTVAEHALVARAHAAGGARVVAVVAHACILVLCSIPQRHYCHTRWEPLRESCWLQQNTRATGRLLSKKGDMRARAPCQAYCLMQQAAT